MLRNIGLGAGAGAASWLGWRTLPWEGWTADYRSAVGERRDIRLANWLVMLMDTGIPPSTSRSTPRPVSWICDRARFWSPRIRPRRHPRPFLVRTRRWGNHRAGHALHGQDRR